MKGFAEIEFADSKKMIFQRLFLQSFMRASRPSGAKRSCPCLSAPAHIIRPGLCAFIARNVVFFLDLERDNRAVVFGEFALDQERESLVAGDGGRELCLNSPRLGDGCGAASDKLFFFTLTLLNAHGELECCDSGIHRAIGIGHCHFRELCGGDS